MMKNLMPRTAAPRLRSNPNRLLRRWVSTYDQRCPLACVWFALGDVIATDLPDEPPSLRPGFLLNAFISPGHLPHVHLAHRHSSLRFPPEQRGNHRAA